jgi:hypothetical protein
MKPLLFISSCLVILTIAAFSNAAEPSTRASVVVDLSTPRAAVRSLVQAVEAQDGRAVLKVFFSADDAERELARTFADLIVSTKNLGDAVRARYGSGVDSLASGLVGPAELAKLDQAEVKQSGDTATLIPMGQSRPMRFRRTEDGWKLMVRDFANAEDDLPQQVLLLKSVARAFDEMTAEIAAGKHERSLDAESAIQTKLAAVMIRAATTSSPATTRSTTQATTRPSLERKP